MSLKQIAALPIRQLGHPDRKCLVFMWCTWPKMRDQCHVRVFEVWQLRWVSDLVWDKQLMGTGRRFRKQTEVLLVGIPRDAPPNLLFQRNDARDILRVPSERGSGRHSSKPLVMYKLLESVAPGPRIELFARCHPPGWDVWGLEAPEETGCDETTTPEVGSSLRTRRSVSVAPRDRMALSAFRSLTSCSRLTWPDRPPWPGGIRNEWGA